jgi:GTP cyclohydrolase I
VIKDRTPPAESETSAQQGRASRAEAKQVVHTLGGLMGDDCHRERLRATPSCVSYFMNKFRSLGLIDYNGALCVRSGLSKLGALE